VRGEEVHHDLGCLACVFAAAVGLAALAVYSALKPHIDAVHRFLEPYEAWIIATIIVVGAALVYRVVSRLPQR